MPARSRRLSSSRRTTRTARRLGRLRADGPDPEAGPPSVPAERCQRARGDCPVREGQQGRHDDLGGCALMAQILNPALRPFLPSDASALAEIVQVAKDNKDGTTTWEVAR